jgi:anti-sigma regulatory factor (Ser/Thr protein kinase)
MSVLSVGCCAIHDGFCPDSIREASDNVLAWGSKSKVEIRFVYDPTKILYAIVDTGNGEEDPVVITSSLHKQRHKIAHLIGI